MLVDDFNTEELVRIFRPFERAAQLLASERARTGGTRLDIERLMTRLSGGMPYDSSRGGEEELAVLLAKLKEAFLNRLHAARRGERHDAEMAALASHIVNKSIDCISFNYDDVLDEALFDVRKTEFYIEEPFWHPDGGYGFFCGAPETCVQPAANFMDNPSVRLLKLHGSMNWRPRRGALQPYAVADMVHFESWRPLSDVTLMNHGMTETDVRALIERHLEAEPFIVPPVLVKSDLVAQPLLKLVWSLAYDTLLKASDVVFVGYSLPQTDLASSYLFQESLAALGPDRITVVGNPHSARKDEIMRSYRRLFPDLDDARFRWDGALAWSRELVAEDATQQQLPLTPPAPP